MTIKQCKSKLFQLGINLGVSPKLISERLLSPDDKKDMLEGRLTDEALFVAVKCWIEAGMPNCFLGDLKPYIPPKSKTLSKVLGNTGKWRVEKI